MSIKKFAPHTTQQDERMITRVQRDFSGGLYADLPASVVPDNGVCYLKNFKNFGYTLSGRTGSKEWGNWDTLTPCASLPTFETNITLSSNTVSNNKRTVVVSGYSFTPSSVGNYIVFSDGKNERIETYVSSTSVKTRTTTTDTKTGTINLRHQVNALYFHKLLKKILLHIGTDIYIARDLTISAWDLAHNESLETIDDSYSVFDEINNDVILFNSSGVYKILIGEHPTNPVYYYKINSAIPDSALIETSSTGTRARRYVYGLAKLSGSGQNRSRITTGVNLLTDSGTNTYNAFYKDYTEAWFDYEINSDYASGNLMSGLRLPAVSGTDPDRHWDVYTIWGTANTASGGVDPVTGEGNNVEAYAWLADVPIMKAFHVSWFPLTNSGVCVSGAMTDADIGSYLSYYKNGAFEKDQITTSPAFNTTQQSFSTLSSGSISGLSNAVAFIGAKKGALLTSSSGVLTPVYGDTFSISDVGRRVFLANGNVLHISGVSGASGLTVEGTTFLTGIGGCWEEDTRNFFDNISDKDLKPRLAGYPLYQRLYTPIADSNLGIITPGWMFVAEQDKNHIYYSQVPDGFEFLAGYHHPQYQEAFVEDGIRGFGEITNTLCIYCKNSTNTINLEDITETTITELGVSITSLTGITRVDTNIGVLDYTSIVNLDSSRQIMITNEPAIRIFDGKKYSENLASQRITNELRKFQFATSAIYTPYIGYCFWGNNE